MYESIATDVKKYSPLRKKSVGSTVIDDERKSENKSVRFG